jgi:(1->4)-alpha-D-glucan 1-alpha-D-glucosylmutase
MMAERRIPVATYRVQFSAQFTFEHARALVPYLSALGITDLYASPILTARRGSAHGYDVADPTRISDELGGEAGFRALTTALRDHGMGLLLDIVPNHTAASLENPWWEDVLQNGPVSPYASYFDLNWRSGVAGLNNKVLLPILGAHYGTVLENGELRLEYGDDGFRIVYYDWRLPVSARSWGEVLAPRLDALLLERGTDDSVAEALAAVVHELQRFAVGTTTQFLATREALARLYREQPTVRAFVDRTVEWWNGRPGDAGSFDRLDQLLGQQPYRLAYWRVASPEINYRRFFDVSDLVSMRVEDERVFDATHARILALVATGEVTGLRIDHIDGLADPLGYLERLQLRLAELLPFEGESAAIAHGAPDPPGGARTSRTSRDAGRGSNGGTLAIGAWPDAAVPACPPAGFYVVVEKILTGEETMPAEWPVCGTTGYEFARAVTGVLVDQWADDAIDAIYRRVTGETLDFREIAYAQKRRVMRDLFVGDVDALALRLSRLAAHDRHARDLTLPELEEALVQVTACFPVYRTYIRDFTVAPGDRAPIEAALAAASRREPENSPAREFLGRVLLLQIPSYLSGEEQQEWLRFVMRWQQFTGPIAAKGVEDTALYVYNRLLALNDVGSEPRLSTEARPPSINSSHLSTEQDASSADATHASTARKEATGDPQDAPRDVTDGAIIDFHTWNLARLAAWPHTLNPTSTHDTKRSEDVRARLAVLSELPEAWGARLDRWRDWNRPRQPSVGGQRVPTGNAELLIYQTLLGAWPLAADEVPAFRQRLKIYLEKAAREAKEHSSWLRPNAEYENAVAAFVDAILASDPSNRFLDDFLAFEHVIAFFGAQNALSQLMLKLFAPGAPDFYQGTELWDFSLVDPDNRRPVDFARRIVTLQELHHQAATDRGRLARDLLGNWLDGRVKLYITHTALTYRRHHADLFASGDYVPLDVQGSRARHALAFIRRRDGAWAMAVVPRLSARLAALAGRDDTPVGGVSPDKATDTADLPPLRAPVGDPIWADTRLRLPPGAPTRWRNVLTDAVIAATRHEAPGSSDAAPTLRLGAVLRDFPVALLAAAPA